MNDLTWQKATTYYARTADHTFLIRQNDRGFQVTISRVTEGSVTIIDFPPQFGSLPAAKTYVDAWRIMASQQPIGAK